MKPLIHVLLRALPAVLLFGCSAIAPDAREPRPRIEPLAEQRACPEALPAAAVLEQGKAEFRDLNFEKAMIFFEQALLQEPGNVEIRRWIERTRMELATLIAGYDGNEPIVGLKAGSAPIVELVEARLELDRHMREFSRSSAARDSARALAALGSAVRRAKSIRALAVAATAGGILSQWRSRGAQELADGECSTADICLQFASLEAGQKVEAGSRLQVEVMRRRADFVRGLDSTVLPRMDRRFQLSPTRKDLPESRGPAPLQAAVAREVCLQLLVVARSRVFTMDREAASSDLDLVESLGGRTEETIRLRAALLRLGDWSPFGSDGSWTGWILPDCSRVIRLQGEADNSESRGEYLGAAEARESIASELSRMPFTSVLDEIGREARASAARCRRWAWDAGTGPCPEETDRATIKNW